MNVQKSSTEPGMGVNPLAADTEAVGPQVAVLFVGVSLFVGMASRHLLKNTSIPYTVALLILGIGLGSLGGLLLSLEIYVIFVNAG